jgi:hypothetical protein
MSNKTLLIIISGVVVILILAFVFGKLLFDQIATTQFPADHMTQPPEVQSNALIVYGMNEQDIFHIQFEYPGTWEWNYTDFELPYWDVCMSTIDPAEPLYGLNGEPNFESGEIQICVKLLDTSDSLTSDYENKLILEWDEYPAIELQLDEIVQIDGLTGRRLVGLISPRYAPMNQVALIQDIFLIASGDKYYEILLEIPESERSAAYGQAFDHLIETLKFLP